MEDGWASTGWIKLAGVMYKISFLYIQRSVNVFYSVCQMHSVMGQYSLNKDNLCINIRIFGSPVSIGKYVQCSILIYTLNIGRIWEIPCFCQSGRTRWKGLRWFLRYPVPWKSHLPDVRCRKRRPLECRDCSSYHPGSYPYWASDLTWWDCLCLTSIGDVRFGGVVDD